jgi:hypothetical protein
VTEPDVLSAISASARRWWKRLHGCTKPPKINSLTTPVISGSLSNLRFVLREGFVIRTPGAFRSLSITGRRECLPESLLPCEPGCTSATGRPPFSPWSALHRHADRRSLHPSACGPIHTDGDPTLAARRPGSAPSPVRRHAKNALLNLWRRKWPRKN